MVCRTRRGDRRDRADPSFWWLTSSGMAGDPGTGGVPVGQRPMVARRPRRARTPAAPAPAWPPPGWSPWTAPTPAACRPCRRCQSRVGPASQGVVSAAATGHNSVTTANSSLQVVSGTSAPLATEPPPGPRVRACSAAESLRNPVQQTEPRQCSHPQPGRCGGALVVMGIPSRPGSCWVRASVQPTTPTPMSMRRRHGGACSCRRCGGTFLAPRWPGREHRGLPRVELSASTLPSITTWPEQILGHHPLVRLSGGSSTARWPGALRSTVNGSATGRPPGCGWPACSARRWRRRDRPAEPPVPAPAPGSAGWTPDDGARRPNGDAAGRPT